MSETLQGVLLGGAIGSLLPAANLIFNCFKWRRQRRLEFLREKRRRLERLFGRTLRLVAESVEKGKWHGAAVIPLLVHAPTSAKNALRELNQQLVADWGNRNSEEVRQEARSLFHMLNNAMEAELAEIDDQIEKASR